MRCCHALFVVCALYSAVIAAAQGPLGSKWLTVDGERPKVIALDGLSGLFPPASEDAYRFARQTSLRDVIFWCNVQLTKDATGICFSSLRLENASNIAQVFANRRKTYTVGGVPMNGYFSVDFTIDELKYLFLSQSVYSRTDKFDGIYPIMTVEEVAALKPRGLWLNIQNVAFFEQFNLSMRQFVLQVSKTVAVNYISSTDVGFLQSISQRFNRNTTQLILRVLGQDEAELSTVQTNSSVLKNLTLVKPYASGIMIHKNLIWPVDATSNYLQAYRPVVLEAHKEGLKVFASGFANDLILAYNYTFDPVREYLQFIDNDIFAVDGVLSDFAITPAMALDCFAHLPGNSPEQVTTLVLSNNGASGNHAGCTDDAYKSAIGDGVDFIDCKVQMTKDAIPFCSPSVNLLPYTNAATSRFVNHFSSVPELNVVNGLCAFSLTWFDIQDLTPQVFSPFAADYRIYRSSASKNTGKFMNLSDFLALAKNTNISGVLISLENTTYLAEKQGLDVIGAVHDALRSSGYYNQTTKRVMIQSTDSSVLEKFKDERNLELVYCIDEYISGLSDSAIKDIQKFAHSVVIRKESVFPTRQLFTTSSTDVVHKLQLHNISVHVKTFRNEFVSQAWDFFSDATVEINSFVMGAGIDGVITEFPRTAAIYKKNRCLARGNNTPTYMSAVPVGGLLQFMPPSAMPPAEAPFPVLLEPNVTEPPFPAVLAPSPNSSIAARPPTSRNAQPKIAGSPSLLGLLVLLAAIPLL